ncbi:phage tail tip lysozyme [Herbaspirillum sp. ST 5-3]|uniref:phage tail tip lysozyme n=1 Tax=Oxalobacteraceae TaxID=75682 RepID=UPI001455EFDB|nr:phage tail tip lysozyme [Herbaspirillum sp. ST 5-3]
MNKIREICPAGIALVVAQLACASAYATSTPPCVAWADGGTYQAGEVVTYNGQTYTALVSHTAYQGAGWNPTVGSLYRPGGQCSGTAAPPSTEGCAAWSEGGTYRAGDVVSYQGKVYTALVTQTDYAGTGWNPTIATLFKSGGTCPGGSPGGGNSFVADPQTTTTTDVQKQTSPTQYANTTQDTSAAHSTQGVGSINSACLPGDGNSFLSGNPQTTMNSDAQKQQLAVAYVKELRHLFNFTSAQAAGVVGNLLLESGLNSGIKQETGTLGEASKDGDIVDRTGYGIAQWGEDRKVKLINLATKMKIPSSSQCANFNHFGNELGFDPGFANVVPAVSAEKTLIGAVCSFEKLYEVPLDPHSQERIQYAKNVMAWLGENYVEGTGSPNGDACDYYRRP